MKFEVLYVNVSYYQVVDAIIISINGVLFHPFSCTFGLNEEFFC